MEPRMPFEGNLVTSTPTPANGAVQFPQRSASMSTIVSGGSRTISQGSGTPRGPRPSSSDSRSSSARTGSTCSSTETVTTAGQIDLRPIKFTKYWKSLMPKDKHSLSYVVCCSPQLIERTVEELFHSYDDDKSTLICSILQLFLDMCGNKNINFREEYEFQAQPNELDMRRIIILLEQHWDRLSSREGELKFFFMKPTIVSDTLDLSLSEFFKQLIAFAYALDILFDDCFLPHLFTFLKLLNRHNYLPIRCSAGILICKLLICFVELCKSISNYSNQDPNIRNPVGALSTHLDQLHKIFYHNCKLSDDRGSLLKIISCSAICRCVLNLPEKFTEPNLLKVLLRHAKDEDEFVRLSALTACEKLFQNKIISDTDELYAKFVSDIGERTKDIDTHVAQRAIHVFIAMVQDSLPYFNKDQIEQILSCIYAKNCSESRLAGQFFAQYAKAKCNGDDKQMLILSAVIAFHKSEWAERVSVFVEACIEFLPILTNFELALQVILKNDTPNVRKNILHLIHEYARFILTGKFDIVRQPIEDDIETSEEMHIHVVETVVPVLEDVLKVFHDDDISILRVLDMLKWLDLTNCFGEGVFENCQLCFQILKNLFDSTGDSKAMETIAIIVHNLFEQNKLTNSRVVEFCNIFTSRVLSGLEALQNNDLSSHHELMEMNRNVKRAAALYTNFDLSNSLPWEEMFNVWTERNFKVLRYLVMCCEWWLIWSIKNFVPDALDHHFANLHRILDRCTDFIEFCMECFQRSPSTAQHLVFLNLCDLFMVYNDELKRKHSPFTRALCLSEVQEKIVTDFIISHVFQNAADATLAQRRELLLYYFNILHLDYIKLPNGCRILQYYHSHQEFQYLMNNFLEGLSAHNSLWTCVILEVLSTAYEELCNTSVLEIPDMNTRQGKDLNLLAKAFSSLDVFSTKSRLKLLSNAITWASQIDKYHPFLVVMRVFTDKMDASDKKDVKEMVNAQFSKDQLKKAAPVRIFLSALK